MCYYHQWCVCKWTENIIIYINSNIHGLVVPENPRTFCLPWLKGILQYTIIIRRNLNYNLFVSVILGIVVGLITVLLILLLTVTYMYYTKFVKKKEEDHGVTYLTIAKYSEISLNWISLWRDVVFEIDGSSVYTDLS